MGSITGIISDLRMDPKIKQKRQNHRATVRIKQWFSTWGSSGIFLGVARVFVRNPFVADLDVVNVFNGCPFIALHLILGENLDICGGDDLFFFVLHSIRNCIACV